MEQKRTSNAGIQLLGLLLRYVLISIAGLLLVRWIVPLFGSEQAPVVLLVSVTYLFFFTAGFLSYAHNKLNDGRNSMILLLLMVPAIVALVWVFS